MLPCFLFLTERWKNTSIPRKKSCMQTEQLPLHMPQEIQVTVLFQSTSYQPCWEQSLKCCKPCRLRSPSLHMKIQSGSPPNKIAPVQYERKQVISRFAHFLKQKMNCIPHLGAKNAHKMELVPHLAKVLWTKAKCFRQSEERSLRTVIKTWHLRGQFFKTA